MTAAGLIRHREYLSLLAVHKLDTEKVQKILARCGLGSRREIERWIKAGRVSVNGKRAEVGARARETDRIRVNGRAVRFAALRKTTVRVLRYHKPQGVVCTRADVEGRVTVFDHLPEPHHGRWITVGRLDINSSGLLLVTNDGELAHRLMHPSSEIEREYAVRVLGEVTPDMIEVLCRGVELSDGLARFESVKHGRGRGANHWYLVTIKEGRNRAVRRIWESQGLMVSRLARVRYGSVTLPRSLPAGDWEELSHAETKALMMSVGMAEAQPERRL